MEKLTHEKGEIAKKIKLVIFDVDGVLTDGTLTYGPEGEYVKHFNVKDGLGLKMLMRHKIGVAVITARESKALIRRMSDLGIVHFYSDVSNKLDVFGNLLNDLDVEPAEVAYVGDDVIDLPVMHEVGLSIAVADAHVLVREDADLVASAKGGSGAAREVADFILASRMPLREVYRNTFSLKN